MAPPDTEQSLEAELQDLFRRILACGRRQGERAALDRIVGLAQSALAEIAEPEGAGPAEAARSEPPAAKEDPERPTQAQGLQPLRPLH